MLLSVCNTHSTLDATLAGGSQIPVTALVAYGVQTQPTILGLRTTVAPVNGALPFTRPSSSTTATQCICNVLSLCVFRL